MNFFPSLNIFLVTWILFVVAFVIHVAWWRIRLPKRQLSCLCRFLLGFLPFGLVVAEVFDWMPFPLVSWETGRICLYYVALTFTYIITYTALEGDSPTLSLMRLAGKRPGGLSVPDIVRVVCARPFVQARWDVLIKDGLVQEKNGRYFSKGSPSLFFRVIHLFRRLYGPIGSGG